MEDINVTSVTSKKHSRLQFHKQYGLNKYNGDEHSVFEKRRKTDLGNVEAIVSEYFNKKFSFQNSCNAWCLVDVEEMFTSHIWKISRLQDMKAHLNSVKNKLNDYDLDDWHKHTRAMNKAGGIQWKIKNEYEPEFVTQAWCKFYESVMGFPLVPSEAIAKGIFNSLHLCEAPGAFVTSLNHFLKTHYPAVKWQWMATTLNPYYEGNTLGNMINDDRFILQTLPHWTFGRDVTGNLMDLNNMSHLTKEVEKIGDILLVTADGSIDCQENPGEQECVVSQLHYCEIVTAFHVLAKGGSFLLKIFTMYEAQTVCLMYLLCCAFAEVQVFKPVTSKEGNSEVYVVCLGYKGRQYLEPWLCKLREHYGPEEIKHVMFPLEKIPGNFIEQIIACAQKFKDFQVDVIENNIQTYEGQKQPFFVKQLKYLVAQHFINHYKIQKLSNESQEVAGKTKLRDTPTFNLEARVERGSFSDKCKQLSPLEELMSVEEQVHRMELSWSFHEDIQWLEFPHIDPRCTITTGRPVDTVYCSKFCVGSLLKLYNQVHEFASHLIESRATANSHEEHFEKHFTGIIKENFPSAAVNMKILSFKEEFQSIVRGSSGQKAIITKLINVLSSLKENENLLILQLAMLTQFNVGIIYFLAHMFKKVGFIKPVKQDFAVIFTGFRSVELLKIFEFIKKVFEELEAENDEKTILSVVPINQLCGRHIPAPVDECVLNEKGEPEEMRKSGLTFYQCITEINNLSVKDRICETVSQLKQIL